MVPGVSARATRGLTDFTGTVGGIKSRLMQAGVTLVGPLRDRWSVDVSGPFLSRGTALNLPPDSPKAGLQSCFMPVRRLHCEKPLPLIIAGKSLGVHFYGMVWEPAGTESPWPWSRTPSGAELLLPLVPISVQGDPLCSVPAPPVPSMCHLQAPAGTALSPPHALPVSPPWAAPGTHAGSVSASISAPRFEVPRKGIVVFVCERLSPRCSRLSLGDGSGLPSVQPRCPGPPGCQRRLIRVMDGDEHGSTMAGCSLGARAGPALPLSLEECGSVGWRASTGC